MGVKSGFGLTINGSEASVSELNIHGATSALGIK